MDCLICKKLVIKEITYLNFLKKNDNWICNICFVKHLYIQKRITIPIEGYVINLNVLFNDYKNALALMSFLKPYYLYYLKSKTEDIILYFDLFTIAEYELVKNLQFNNLFIITLKNIFIKEKKYED